MSKAWNGPWPRARVTTIGYPYSISAYFRRANANMSRTESRKLVEQLRKATKDAGRDLVVYISMAFGNPYEEPWGPEIVEDALIWLLKEIGGLRTVSLADTVAHGNASWKWARLFTAVKDCVAGVELGVHLHSRPEGSAEKIMAAYNAGRAGDSIPALTGLGGVCPFAGDRPRGQCRDRNRDPDIRRKWNRDGAYTVGADACDGAIE